MDFVSRDHICRSRVYIRDMAGRPPLKDAPAFGAQLAELRKARKWTQPELAQKLGITSAALVHYERKATNPSAEFVSKVAALFNVSVDELLGHTVKPAKKPGPPSQLEERLTAIRHLSRDKQKVVLQLLDSFLQTNGKPTANGSH